MLLDASDVQRDSALHADVLIIGAGAAGITLARALAGTRTKTLLLESGGFEGEQATQALAHALTSKTDYPIDETRLRYFGGTTNHWGGWCRPMDPWVFEHRPWVAEVGWPIGPADLADYYRRAAPVVELPTDPLGWTWDWPYWREQLPKWEYKTLPESATTTGVMFRFSPPTRFGTTYRKELHDATNVTVVLHANALELRTNENATRVTEVPVATLDGNQFTVAAQHVVVAVGGLEAPRLLLLSNSTRPDGLGNDHDLVGRYFMDHIEGSVGTVELNDRPHVYMPGVFANARAMFALTPEAMEHERLLGCMITFDDNDGVAKFADEDNGVTAEAVGGLRTTLAGGRSDAIDVVVRAEPKPLAASRAVLSGQRDALGQKRLELQYVRSPDIESTIRRSLELFARELGRAGLGRMRIDLDHTDDASSDVGTVGWHLMGTTRMARNPNEGVVDADLRVHGVDNLYIASSSVFPTAGYSNPTLTIVALTLRLADHLMTRLG